MGGRVRRASGGSQARPGHPALDTPRQRLCGCGPAHWGNAEGSSGRSQAMTSPVVEARARTQAALARWREARKGVNNPTSVPDRLDAIVAVAERTITAIGQDIV